MRNDKDLRRIGYACKIFRQSLGISQAEVAEQTGYSESNISSFETGRTNNMMILLYYLRQGMEVSELWQE